jgi:hypothetical protein
MLDVWDVSGVAVRRPLRLLGASKGALKINRAKSDADDQRTRLQSTVDEDH